MGCFPMAYVPIPRRLYDPASYNCDAEHKRIVDGIKMPKAIVEAEPPPAVTRRPPAMSLCNLTGKWL